MIELAQACQKFGMGFAVLLSSMVGPAWKAYINGDALMPPGDVAHGHGPEAVEQQGNDERHENHAQQKLSEMESRSQLEGRVPVHHEIL